jgi:ketosteroid isomerase-like protein
MTSDLLSLVRRHLEAENDHDLEGTLATLHPECRFDDFATGQSWFGHEGAAAHYRHWRTTFDVEVRRGEGQRRYIADDGHISEATWHGRHVGRFFGIEPMGRTIVQPFVVILSFRDGLMLGERFHYDLASLVRKITVDPLTAVAALDHRNAAVTGSDR